MMICGGKSGGNCGACVKERRLFLCVCVCVGTRFEMK